MDSVTRAAPATETSRRPHDFVAPRASSFRALLSERTTLTEVEAAGYLTAAWHERFREAAGHAAPVLLAHWALETDRGRHMPGFNFAGIKAHAGDAEGAVLETVEGFGATARRVHCRFRSYRTPLDGARDYVNLLANHYPEAVFAARAGDPARFVDALQQGGYFTGDPAAYRSASLRLWREFVPFVQGVQRLRVDAPAFLVEAVVFAFQRASAHRG